ncbi:protein translocase subunit SecF, partial [Streptomyces wedmorensis]
PLVADLKEREPSIKALRKRIEAKRASAAAKGESADDTDALSVEAETAVVGPRSSRRGTQEHRG